MAKVAEQEKKKHPFELQRESRGLSLRQAAERAGVDYSWLGRVERGEAEGSLGWLARVASALGMEEDAARFARYDPRAR